MSTTTLDHGHDQTHGHDHAHGHDDHAHDHPTGLRRWLFATNHKDIGTLYLWFSFIMLLSGGVLALMIRFGALKRPAKRLRATGKGKRHGLSNSPGHGECRGRLERSSSQPPLARSSALASSGNSLAANTNSRRCGYCMLRGRVGRARGSRHGHGIGAAWVAAQATMISGVPLEATRDRGLPAACWHCRYRQIGERVGREPLHPSSHAHRLRSAPTTPPTRPRPGCCTDR